MAFLDELRRITRPYVDGEDDYIENDEAEEYIQEPEKPVRAAKPVKPAAKTAKVEKTEMPAEPAPQRSVFSKRETKPVSETGAGKQKLLISNPTVFEDGAEIANALRDKRTVLMNLEHADRENARRLLDFLSGAAYALGGNIKRLSEKAYIITSTNVDILGSTVEELENSGFYF